MGFYNTLIDNHSTKLFSIRVTNSDNTCTSIREVERGEVQRDNLKEICDFIVIKYCITQLSHKRSGKFKLVWAVKSKVRT